MTSRLPDSPSSYAELLALVKQRIRQGQTRAVLAANAELIRLYWDIGRMLHTRQQQQGWGAAVIPGLSQDIRNELPEVKGFSERNIKLMVQFHHEYPSLFSIGQLSVAQLPGTKAARRDGHDLYPSVEEKAAHLLYFVIKDHPFTDGNKRIGSFLFVLFLHSNGLLEPEKCFDNRALVSLALLTAASDPGQKELMIRLIMNLISEEG